MVTVGREAISKDLMAWRCRRGLSKWSLIQREKDFGSPRRELLRCVGENGLSEFCGA